MAGHRSGQQGIVFERQHSVAQHSRAWQSIIQGLPQGGGGVDDVQGAVPKGGLPVQAPAGLLLVAVSCRVTASSAVSISLHQHKLVMTS